MFRFHCKCGKKLGVRDSWADKRVKCPECGNTVVAVPEATAVPDESGSDAVPLAPPPSPGRLMPTAQPIGLPPLPSTPSPLSYANADLPRKGALARASSFPEGRPRRVGWFLLISIVWLVINLLFFASFHYDLNRTNPNFVRPLLLVVVWFLTGVGVLASWLMLIYAVHKDVGNLTAGGYDISPAKAVGFSFIPGFSAFWVVYMPSRLMGELNRQLRAVGKSASAGTIVGLQAASIPLGLLVPALAPLMYSITIIRIQNALNQIWLAGKSMPASPPAPGPDAMIVDPT